jgi:hypothetical protein
MSLRNVSSFHSCEIGLQTAIFNRHLAGKPKFAVTNRDHVSLSIDALHGAKQPRLMTLSSKTKNSSALRAQRRLLNLMLVVISLILGCEKPCHSDFDCPEQSFCSATQRCTTECFTDEDCLRPPECAGNPSACLCKGSHCNPYGACVGGCGFDDGKSMPDVTPDPTGPAVIEGYDDPAGSGKTFIFSSLGLAPSPEDADLSALCQESQVCQDNGFWIFGELANASIQEAVNDGETLILLELNGIDNDFRGNDRNLSVKLYSAYDADWPARSSNNFAIPQGANKCCEFIINEYSLSPNTRQALARAPARLVQGELLTLGTVNADMVLGIGKPPHSPIKMNNLRLSGRVASDFSKIRSGLFSTVLPAQDLARRDNPYCKEINLYCPEPSEDSSLLDLALNLLQPDVDLDHDGLEHFLLGPNRRVGECYDGCGRQCSSIGPLIPPSISNDPSSCVFHEDIQDGFSSIFRFEATEASIVGVGSR